MSTNVGDDLKALYSRRFSGKAAYRQKVWRILVSDFFSDLVPRAGAVLDLGCGHGEFINQLSGPERFAIDLNPDSGSFLDPGIHWLQHDCSTQWPLEDNSLDLIFTSNFFEHLSDKAKLLNTLKETHRCLRPGGRIVALGPNIKYVRGSYWDHWDHHVALTEASMAEVLQSVGFRLRHVVPRFLPYTMSDGPQYPVFLLRVYLKLSPLWRIFGKQFLIIGEK
jgi:SAM-dependent methyltransferase